MPDPYLEEPADLFDYETDWFEVAEDVEKGSAHFGDENQEDTLIGYVRWNKRRDALRFFKGWHYATDASGPGAGGGGRLPYGLYREHPHAHPDYPWLRAFDVSFTGTVLTGNPELDDKVQDESPFDIGGRRTRYKWAVTTVRYRSFKNCRFLDDEDLPTTAQEWQRYTIIDPPDTLVEALTVSGGLSQLKFAETGTGGPSTGSSGTAFGVPLAELQVKTNFKLLWMNVPWDYLSADEYFFKPTRILAGLGKVNENDAFVPQGGGGTGFEAETLYLTGAQYSAFPAWRAAFDWWKPILYVNVLFHFQHFDPERGATTPYRRGHNNMPWSGDGTTSGDGKYYYATRNGNLPNATSSPGRPFLQTYDFDDLFRHVSDPT